MQTSRLWRSLEALSGWELNALRKFLASPYFNQREDLVQLLECLLTYLQAKETPSPTDVWKAIFPERPYEAQQLRLLMSYLQQLVNQFLLVEALQGEPAADKRRLAEIWRQKGQADLQQQALSEAERLLDKNPTRNADHHFERYLLYRERYRQAYRRRPEKGEDFQPLDRAFNLAFVAMKLRETCLLLAHEQVYRWGFRPSLLAPLSDYIRENGLLNEPAVGIYWHGIQMLRQPEEETHFRTFKNTLLSQAEKFPRAEVQDLYLLAINYGVRRVNDGRRRYFHDIMDFYRDGLEQEYLLQDGQLSRFTYHNIVSVALQIGQADWAEDFIAKWTSRLDRRYRERMESFNRAKIAYHRRRYGEALPLLQRANYHDPLLNLGARTLLLKIYYELDEHDALVSHLDAFRAYLERKPELGYHRTNYRRLIRYTHRLLALRPGDREQRDQLRREIETETVLTEKEWLLSLLV